MPPLPRRQCHAARVRASTKQQPAQSHPNAREACNAGDDLFEAKKYREALAAYRAAMSMEPNEDEARAAQYNQACAHVRLQQWQEASQCLKQAVNVYNLKYSYLTKARSPALSSSCMHRVSGGQ
jgi:tetratricopeptide (TPR) repeat protein